MSNTNSKNCYVIYGWYHIPDDSDIEVIFDDFEKAKQWVFKKRPNYYAIEKWIIGNPNHTEIWYDERSDWSVNQKIE